MSPAASYAGISAIALFSLFADRFFHVPESEHQASSAIDAAASAGVSPTIPSSSTSPASETAADSSVKSDAATLASRFQQIRSLKDRMEFVADTMRYFAAEEPHGALSFAESLPPGPWRIPALVESLEILANAGDAGAALRSLHTIIPSAERDAATISIASAWAKCSPSDAMEWSAALNDETLRASAMEGVISTWADSDPAGALSWINTAANVADTDYMIDTVTASWAAADPLSALSWAKSQFAANPDGPNPVITVYREWAGSDPESAALKLMNEEPSMQLSLMPCVLKSWIETDATAATDWSNQLSDPTSRSVATSILAKHARGGAAENQLIGDENIEVEPKRPIAD
jgi:hypothetical protein